MNWNLKVDSSYVFSLPKWREFVLSLGVRHLLLTFNILISRTPNCTEYTSWIVSIDLVWHPRWPPRLLIGLTFVNLMEWNQIVLLLALYKSCLLNLLTNQMCQFVDYCLYTNQQYLLWYSEVIGFLFFDCLLVW